MAVLLGAESVAQAKTLIQSIKSNAYNGGATGVVPPQRRQPLSSSASRKEIDYSYNGYFTLKLIEIVNEDLSKSYKVRIVDGATYDPDTGTSGNNTARVNNVTFSVVSAESDIITETSIFALRYTVATSILEIVNLKALGFSSLPNDDGYYSWYQLGRILVSSGSFSTIQDHVTGVAQLWHYLLCLEQY